MTSLDEAPNDRRQALAVRPFLAGPENHLLTQASATVTHDWARFNPLFICGGSGVGKSHLLRCLTACAGQTYPELRRLACSGADYARSVSDAIDVDSIDELRGRHRSVDLFALDGLHELVGKHAAEQELLTSIERLVEDGAMVLIASRPGLDELPEISPLLASRLSSGLQITLAPPEPATCGAILQQLARQHDVVVPPELLERFTTPREVGSRRWSVADLKSSINELQSATPASGAPTPACMARPPATAKQINKAVARYFQVTLRDLTGVSRRRNIVRARALAAYLIRTIHAAPLAEIGSHLGGRDHTTVLHALRRANNLLETDPEFKRAAVKLTALLE